MSSRITGSFDISTNICTKVNGDQVLHLGLRTYSVNDLPLSDCLGLLKKYTTSDSRKTEEYKEACDLYMGCRERIMKETMKFMDISERCIELRDRLEKLFNNRPKTAEYKEDEMKMAVELCRLELERKNLNKIPTFE